MPKNALLPLLDLLRRDIRRSYPVGARFLPTRAIAEKYKVSLQTAHRAVQILTTEGVLLTRDRVEITVAGHLRTGRQIVLLSNNPDPRFNQAFLKGIRETAQLHDHRVELRLATSADITDSLKFGQSIVQMAADAVIALGFRKAPLPFYHAMREGVEMISDVELDELSILPSVQTDNRRHARTLAERMTAAKRRVILVAGYWTETSRRLQYFREAVGELSPETRIQYIYLGQPESGGLMHQFFAEFPPDAAVFSLECSANWVVAPYFLQFGIDPTERFCIYDCEEAEFRFPGLPPVRPVAPSLAALGRRMAEKLVHRWETGAWPEPLHERL